jgi:hypothetical protein
VRQAIVRGPQIGQWLAVDPGGMTGWVLFRPVVDTEQLAGIGLEILDWGETKDQMRFCDMVWRLNTARLPSERLAGIVIEGWWPRDGVRTWQPEAVEIIGTCRWVMQDDPLRFFVQKPSDREWATPEKINRYRRENGAPNNVGKGGQGHAVQALRHALLFASTRWSPR